MNWTVLVPFKAAGGRKSRLAPEFDDEAREAMAVAMLGHVAAVLATVARITPVLASPHPEPGWDGRWLDDGFKPLNQALAFASDRIAGSLAIVHADLPLLTAADVEALIVAAEEFGSALAPDRHECGVNALALAGDRPGAFFFGADSFPQFQRALGARTRIVRRQGLAMDCDTAADVDAARVAGATWGSPGSPQRRGFPVN